jgi:hypothetical protein
MPGRYQSNEMTIASAVPAKAMGIPYISFFFIL